jgi:hypothetical protein
VTRVKLHLFQLRNRLRGSILATRSKGGGFSLLPRFVPPGTGSAAMPPGPERGGCYRDMHVGLPPKTHASQEWARPPRAEWAEKWANWALNESIIRIICRVGRPVRGLRCRVARSSGWSAREGRVRAPHKRESITEVESTEVEYRLDEVRCKSRPRGGPRLRCARKKDSW